MKKGLKPNRKQKEAIEYAGLNSDNWLVFKNLEDELHLVHRNTDKVRVIPK